MLRSGGSLRATAAALVIASLLAITVGCASDDEGPAADRGAFGRAMEERYGIDEDTAACISGYVVEDYDAAEIAVLIDEGMAGLPQARWEGYLNATVTCITHDEPLDGLP